MPSEVIDRPSPDALESRLPANTLELMAKPPKIELEENVARSLRDFRDAACYIAASELQRNIDAQRSVLTAR